MATRGINSLPMAVANSSKTATNETPQDDSDFIWIELKLLQSIVIQSRLGQTVAKLVDNSLWIVEKCAEWSLPKQEIGDEKEGKTKLVRPLPWFLFLPSLVMLRIIRMTVNVGISILGYPKITSSKMVKLVQKSRWHLQAAMEKENKERNESEDKRSSKNETKKGLIKSIRLTLLKLSCLDASKPSPSPPPTKIYVSSVLNSDPESTPKETSETDTETFQNSTGGSIDVETVDEKFIRMFYENYSEGDEDFDPTKHSSIDTNSDEVDDEVNDEDKVDDEDSDTSGLSVTRSEINDIAEEAGAIMFEQDLKIKQFLKAEQASALNPKEESVKPDDGKRSSAKESRDKVEEHLAALQRIDSPECYTPNRSSQEGDHQTFYSPIGSDNDAPQECSVPPVSFAEQCVSRKILMTNEFINGEVRFITLSTSSEFKSSRQSNNDVMEKRSKT